MFDAKNYTYILAVLYLQWPISCIFEVLRDARLNSRFLARLARLKEIPFLLLKFRFSAIKVNQFHYKQILDV